MIPVLVCLGLFCSPVTTTVGNPPAGAAMTGWTQAVMTYPGHHFGMVFIAHVGTPEGWEIAEAVRGETVTVTYRNGMTDTFKVANVVPLQLGFDTMKTYRTYHSAPVSFETCILDGLDDWGRMFVVAG